MKQTLFGAPMSDQRTRLTAADVTENAPVPGATQTTSGVGLLLLRAQNTFSVPFSVPVRTFQRRRRVVAAFPLHAA
jgi:hypothetical protein